MAETVTEAGAIAIREAGGTPQVLVVRSSDGRHRVFPKGHIEPGEEPGEAALRELREEAGLAGRLVGPAGSVVFEAGGDRFHVEYFLVLVGAGAANGGTGAAGGEPGRDPLWLAPDRAADALSFDDARALLRRLEPAIHTALAPGGPS